MTARTPAKNKSKRNRRRHRTIKRKQRKIIRFVSAGFLLILLSVIIIHFVRLRNSFFHTFDDSEFSDKYLVRGVDVSHHNSFINWEQLRDENVTFVYLKSTEGMSHKDRNYKSNYRAAKRAGLKVGTYHFYIFGLDGRRQAEHFISTSSVHSGDLIPSIDVEHSPINVDSRSKSSRAKMLTELKNMEQALFEHYGKHPIIYTNKDCYIAYIESEFPNNPIWICDLHHEPTIAEDKWVIWQFSHTGKLAAATDDIDLNYYRYSFTDFQQLLMP
ncbi:hypothetical protein C0T31_02565 [Dysgonamonadaceae bacterium]|nr:hypothetical protein C0T31_02565 [Dysgonamonadaceae bacterium]